MNRKASVKNTCWNGPAATPNGGVCRQTVISLLPSNLIIGLLLAGLELLGT